MDWSEWRHRNRVGVGHEVRCYWKGWEMRTKRSALDLATREPLGDSAAEISGEQWKQRAEGRVGWWGHSVNLLFKDLVHPGTDSRAREEGRVRGFLICGKLQ